MSGENCDAKVDGRTLYDTATAGRSPYEYVGRTGGYEGWEFRHDLATGEWESFSYEVRLAPISGNRNWFKVSDFVAAIDLRADGQSHRLAGREWACPTCGLTRSKEQFADPSGPCSDCS